MDGNYGDSFIKIAADTVHSSPTNQNINGWGLQVVDYFTPSNEQALDAADRDLGSGSPILLPDAVGSVAHPHLLFGGGKEGKLYLIDRDNMGKSDPIYDQAGVLQTGGTDHVVQTIAGALSGLLSTPSLANVGTTAAPDWRMFLMPGYGGALTSYSIANGLLSSAPASTASDVSYGNLSGSPSLSQNGTTNSIVWAIDRTTGTLRIRCDKFSKRVIHQCVGPIEPRSTFRVARQILGSHGGRWQSVRRHHECAGDLRTAHTADIAPCGATSLTAVAPFPSQVLLKWTDNASNEDLFSIERSPDGIVGWVEVGQASANAVSFTDNSVAANTTYYYRVRAFNSYGGGSYSDYSNVATATTTANPGGSGDGLLGTYYEDMEFSGAIFQRIDPQINFDWGAGRPLQESQKTIFRSYGQESCGPPRPAITLFTPRAMTEFGCTWMEI